MKTKKEEITITITREELELIKGCVYKVFNKLYMFNKNANKETVKTFQDLWNKIKDK